MRTGSRTTYILLERGFEDIELLKELHAITVATGIKNGKEFAKKYPRILELKQGLEAEKERDEGN